MDRKRGKGRDQAGIHRGGTGSLRRIALPSLLDNPGDHAA